MKRLVVLVGLLVAVAVLLGSCGTQRVGEMQRETQMVDLENAQSVVTELRMGAGELNVSGGTDALMETDFAYNVSDWKPEVSYDVSGDTGELIVQQGSGEGVPVGGNARNEWEALFNDEVPIDLKVEMGAGESGLDLDSLNLTGLRAEGGLGKINAEGLQREGESYVNDAYGDSDVTLEVEVQGGFGQINLEVV